MSLAAYTSDRAGAIPGPAWLTAQRVAAAERLVGAELPDDSLEEWRYSRIGRVDLDAVSLPHAAAAAAAGIPSDLPDLGASAGRIVVRNGSVVAAELDEALVSKGVRFGPLADSDDALGGTFASAALGSSEHVADVDVFGELNVAFGAAPLLLSVPRGVVVEAPLHLVVVTDADGALVLPRLVVVAGENSELTLVEWSTSSGRNVVVPRTEIEVAPSARVTVVTVNALGPDTDQLGATHATVGQEATLRMTHLAVGGSYSRSRFDCRLVGRGATGRLAALYVGDGDQMHDLRTFQTHEARDTTSELLFKGALDDRAHAVYTGNIRVDHEGRGSNANQTNRVIKLSDDAWAESVPNLEINHNDVRCSHATAVGPIDEDQRFYLESRGVPPEIAERLVVNGFFEEVLDTVPVAEVTAAARPLIAAKLGGDR